MGASGKWFKSLISLKKTATSTTDQEKIVDNKSKKKWKLWRNSSEGSSTSVKKGGAAVSDSSLTAAVAVVVRAPPKDFMVIKQEWAAIRIQSMFRAFLVGKRLSKDRERVQRLALRHWLETNPRKSTNGKK